MAKVLRGGRWGNIQSRSASRASRGQDEDLQPDSEPQAVEEERKQLGVAAYDLSVNEIQISKVPIIDDYAAAARIAFTLEKCHIVLPASYQNNDKLIRALSEAKQDELFADEDERVIPDTKDGSEGHESESHEQLHGDLAISYLPNRDFGYGRAAELFSLITVLGMPADLQPSDRISFLSHVHQDDSCIIRSVGGLLSFIIGNGIFGSLMEDDNSIHLNAISRHNYAEVMKLTSTTLRALHVFSQEIHPVGRSNLRWKEGFSLFGILKSYTKTLAARHMLRSWLQYPSTDLEKIQQRQFFVDVMKGSSNRAFLTTIKESLRGVKSVPAILNRLRQVCADISDWKSLYSSAKSFIALLETLKVAAEQNRAILESTLVASALSVEDVPLRETVRWIDAVTDLEESAVQGRMVVSAGFSEEIDDLKHSYAALDDFLTKIGVQELKTLLNRDDSIEIESLSATYEPQIGFLIALSEKECDRVGDDCLEEYGLSFVFRSEDQRFFKNDRCRELDNDPGDIHGQICDLEAKAYRYLSTKILDYSPSLVKMFRFVTELDCLQALASAAAEHGWVRPSLSIECTDLDIEEGRHPLLELAVPSFVPNSTKMRCGDVNVVTGPNYSGKSVYLSQVALIIILAQIGSFVPAKKARIGLIGGINCRISSFESVTFGQSSFFADAAQVASMLTRAPKRSLNLIDEFGKGTLEVDGMALLVSTLRTFLQMEGRDAPYTICATHFTEILKEPFLPLDNRRLGLYSMEVMTSKSFQSDGVSHEGFLPRPGSNTTGTRSTSKNGRSQVRTARNATTPHEAATANDISTVIRTYRLLSGSICNESRALQCALEVGVDKSLLERAAHIRMVIEKDEKMENALPTPLSSPRIRELVRKVKDFKATRVNLDHTNGGSTGR